jgi:hypothetical protein
MKINITKEDIFYYVTGISRYDALEIIIDPTRYTLYPDSIWDKVVGVFIRQETDYVYYFNEVEKLKNLSPHISISEIRRLCEEIEEITPKQIKLNV